MSKSYSFLALLILVTVACFVLSLVTKSREDSVGQSPLTVTPRPYRDPRFEAATIDTMASGNSVERKNMMKKIDALRRELDSFLMRHPDATVAGDDYDLSRDTLEVRVRGMDNRTGTQLLHVEFKPDGNGGYSAVISEHAPPQSE